jgi:hypothetical protein
MFTTCFLRLADQQYATGERIKVRLPSVVAFSRKILWSFTGSLRGVAQSFPLLETLRPLLREEPQSLKGKTLRYPALPQMKQSETGISLKVDQIGPPVVITFAPEIPLGTRNLRATLNGRALNATIRSYEQDAPAEVKFSGGPNTEVVLSFEPGVGPWVHGTHLSVGDRSHGLRVLSSKLEGHIYSAHVEGRPDFCSRFP